MKFAPERVRLPWIEEGRAGDHLYVRDNLVAAASSILGISSSPSSSPSSSSSSSSPSSPPPPPPPPSSYPPAAVASFQSMCTCGGYRSLFVMLEKFFTFTPLIAGDLPAIQRSADEFVSRQKESNVAYTEVRFSPHLLCCADPENPSNAVLTPTEVTDAVIRGIRAGCARERIHVNIILCCIAWRPEWAGSIVDLAAHYRASQNARFDPSTMSWSSHVRRCSVFSDFYTGNVVGVDIAAGEEHFFKDTHPHLHGPHVEAMQKAHEQGIKITMHAVSSSGGRDKSAATSGRDRRAFASCPRGDRCSLSRMQLRATIPTLGEHLSARLFLRPSLHLPFTLNLTRSSFSLSLFFLFYLVLSLSFSLSLPIPISLLLSFYPPSVLFFLLFSSSSYSYSCRHRRERSRLGSRSRRPSTSTTRRESGTATAPSRMGAGLSSTAGPRTSTSRFAPHHRTKREAGAAFIARSPTGGGTLSLRWWAASRARRMVAAAASATSCREFPSD